MNNANQVEEVRRMGEAEQGERRMPFNPPTVSADQRAVVAGEWGTRGHDAVMRIPVSVRFVLGMTKMSVSKLMSLTRGSIIPLDRKVGDLVDIVVNDKVVARGEVVVLDEEVPRFAISVREVVHSGDE
jgi:flagellar motor switch protein FliN